LNQNHVASQQASRICTTSGVGFAPKHNTPVCVCWVSQDFMQLYSKAIQVPDMKRSKICMEAVVEKRVIDGEIYRWGGFRRSRDRDRSWLRL